MAANDVSGMRAGTGFFEFEDIAAGSKPSVKIFYHVPARVDPHARLMIALHGLDRAAASFRDAFIASSERLGRAVVVPEFGNQSFPGVFEFTDGNVVSPPPGTRLHDRRCWSFGLIERLFADLARAGKVRADGFDLYGNSAGSQFVLRYAALNEAPFLRNAIASNSGVYMLPDLSLDYPHGMGGIGLNDADMRRYLSRPIRILLGEADTDEGAADLPRSPEAAAQGPHRLARGLWHYRRCEALAGRLGVAFGWTVEIVPGARHVAQAVFDRAMTISV